MARYMIELEKRFEGLTLYFVNWLHRLGICDLGLYDWKYRPCVWKEEEELKHYPGG